MVFHCSYTHLAFQLQACDAFCIELPGWVQKLLFLNGSEINSMIGNQTNSNSG